MAVLFWVKVTVASIYVALGSWLIFNPTQFAGINLDPATGRIIGVILLIYGLFRLYTHYIEFSRGEE
jgi:hypothetical protein